MHPSQETFIVIDPGHGGGDPGAVSRKFSVREKDVNLAFALYMEDYIKTVVIIGTVVAGRYVVIKEPREEKK